MKCSIIFLSIFILGIIGRRVDDDNLNEIYFNGRVSQYNQDFVQFDWSMIEIEMTFYGYSVSAIFKDNQNMYDAYVDGKLVKTFQTTSSQTEYLISNSLSNGIHTVSLSKRTEASFGIVQFGGFNVNDTKLISPIAQYATAKRKIEFIGDSITCGYGDLGVPPCAFSPNTENAALAYGNLVATHFGAQLFSECWSGRGMVRNYGDKNMTSKYPLPSYYIHTLANDYQTTNIQLWNFTNFIPDAVVINLGTNDYSTPPQPTQQLFVNGYMNFISFLRENYLPHNPQLQMFLVCGPMIGGECCDYVQDVVSLNKQNNVHYINLEGILGQGDIGCNGHPNTIGHSKMAQIAIKEIAQVMNW